MKDLLYNYYGKAFGSNLRHDVKYENCSESYFEIKDRDINIACNKGEGVSAFLNPSCKSIVIIDFENFVNQWRGNAGKGKKCDFILYDEDEYIILNELTYCKPEYLDQHTNDGPISLGKRSIALKQIQSTIDKLHNVNEIKTYIDKTPKKIGLFSYKINECSELNETISKSNVKFNSIKAIFSNISSESGLTDGFVFEQRVYPIPFEFE